MLSDNDFSELLERYNYAYKYGKIVQGVVVSVENSGLLVDIKSKACAICPTNEILLSSNDSIRDIFKIGETYDFSINSARFLEQMKISCTVPTGRDENSLRLSNGSVTTPKSILPRFSSSMVSGVGPFVTLILMDGWRLWYSSR